MKIELNKSDRKFAMMSQTRTRSTFGSRSLALQFAAHLSNDAYSGGKRAIYLEGLLGPENDESLSDQAWGLTSSE